ncbi:MAG: 16S rRNA (adenine(1518)-N(6)/adenine(1519)-N(6))-dimethyltransferase RsmA [Ferrovum sp.]|nr:16S rRNA (adenine(1518)-N(6)/adenine(1519)-N(6))-dimethyltransferase RsmA [Ferrovum sp.]NDU87607.1 16S rRNA (adenine(1518)-N(6)/adenine(1519)-N(6))-dimethyltransferase RsmA [Ferrovum sp.]
MSTSTHQPRKRFGQHFLNDHGIIQSILSACHPLKHQTLIEIGPGLGALTQPLLDRGLSLTLIELDRDLVAHWQRHPAADRLTLIAADVLTVDFSQFGNSWRLLGNLPYNISTPLLFHLATTATHMTDAHFMLQKEVVDRLVAAPGTKDYGRLSVMLQYHFHLEALFDVPPEAFSPPPKVNSAVIRLIPKTPGEQPSCDPQRLSQVVAQAFSQRRKMLRSTLKGWLTDKDWESLGIDPQRRAETLSLAEFARLSARITAPQVVPENS